MSGRILLAIPVFNEEQYVTSVLDQAGVYCRDILVIDDGSTDATPTLLEENGGIHLIRHPRNRGYGESLSDAFHFAQQEQFEWLVTMDCDEQHEASSIPKFVAAASRGEADIISGTRYPKGHDADAAAPVDRRAINRRITAMLNQQLGLNITDAFCGFKAYRVSALRHLAITVPGYAMPMQFWVQVARAGLCVWELPVPLIYNDLTRHFGGSLDDPAVRLAHYLDVFEAELSAGNSGLVPLDTRRACCR